ncbi:MAG TPA: NADP-dependent isocitrate dehydrogenase [Acidimicrobiales bacterium]|nr:NADP-dependent isocitrate dehydrogenase [Acidimicrobiales bacterium]
MTEPISIIYTHTDEAPALATYSLLPIVQAYAGVAGARFETRDISLAGRILAAFPDHLREDQRVPDALAELEALTSSPEANIIKLPNISASVPQLRAAITELQAQGFAVPDYPENPSDNKERHVRSRYDAVKGSAVNPVLRQGNSDRRIPPPVKNYARAHPHWMGAWTRESKTDVVSMTEGDFRHTENSVIVREAGTLRIELVADGGGTTVLADDVSVEAGEIVDAAVMRVDALSRFVGEQMARAKEDGVLFSVHLKATMMKVSDPVIFGHVIRAFFPATFARYGDALEAAGLNAADGLASIFDGLASMPEGAAIRASFDEEIAAGPRLAMVDSDRGITNLHLPNSIIIDASMPAMIRNSGHMWGPDGEEADTRAVVPDSSYSGVYKVFVDDCRANGALDPATMGDVPNVGLMAKAAEEYGSHDTTFELSAPGTVRVVDRSGTALLEQPVSAGDIFRVCRTKDVAVRDWVHLAVRRARATGDPAVFWLDATRPHDAKLMEKVRAALAEEKTDDLSLEIMDPASATARSLERIRRGENTISVTGNVLRDYLTDLFPIMEVGTSAKMLSIVPLLAGGALFETGAGGSAPKHVQQLLEEDFLRWDSLGEFLALAVSLALLAEETDDPRIGLLAAALDRATERLLTEGKSPGRKLGAIDNRGSHFFLALYWSQELAAQTEDPALAEAFSGLAKTLADAQEAIVDELKAVQGSPVDLGGYYHPDPARTAAVMRPSATFNAALDAFGAEHGLGFREGLSG